MPQRNRRSEVDWEHLWAYRVTFGHCGNETHGAKKRSKGEVFFRLRAKMENVILGIFRAIIPSAGKNTPGEENNQHTAGITVRDENIFRLCLFAFFAIIINYY